MSAQRWGLWGLLAFEAILAAFLFSFGISSFVFIAAIDAALLAFALVVERDTKVVPAWVFFGLAAVTLWRGLAQMWGAPLSPGYMTYLVPVGFVVAGLSKGRSRMLAVGIALVGLARAWFVLSYFNGQALPIAFANVFGAVGCAVWAYGAWRREALKPETDVASA